jgi:hypothetical protein
MSAGKNTRAERKDFEEPLMCGEKKVSLSTTKIPTYPFLLVPSYFLPFAVVIRDSKTIALHSLERYLEILEQFWLIDS